MTNAKTKAFLPTDADKITVQGGAPWIGEQNIFIDDSQSAATTVVANDGVSYELRAFDFGITPADIPLDATILSLILTIHGSSDRATIVDENIQIMIGANREKIGDNAAETTPWPTVASDIVRGIGRWGLDKDELTPAMMHDQLFGVVLQFKNTAGIGGLPATVSIKYVTLEVWYGVAVVADPVATTATYSASLLTSKDHIRLALGDIDTTAPLLADATINAKLAAYSYQEALAQLAEALIAEFGQMPDAFSESGGISQRWGERIAAWKLVADMARSGKIITPGATRKARTRAAVGAMTAQATTDNGFRAD